MKVKCSFSLLFPGPDHSGFVPLLLIWIVEVAIPSFILNCLLRDTWKPTEVVVVLHFSLFFLAFSHSDFSAAGLWQLRVIWRAQMCSLHRLFAQGLPVQPHRLMETLGTFSYLSAVSQMKWRSPRANGNLGNYAAIKEIIEAGWALHLSFILGLNSQKNFGLKEWAGSCQIQSLLYGLFESITCYIRVLL